MQTHEIYLAWLSDVRFRSGCSELADAREYLAAQRQCSWAGTWDLLMTRHWRNGGSQLYLPRRCDWALLNFRRLLHCARIFINTNQSTKQQRHICKSCQNYHKRSVDNQTLLRTSHWWKRLTQFRTEPLEHNLEGDFLKIGSPYPFKNLDARQKVDIDWIRNSLRIG